jgi:hypothetical protein
MSDLEISTEQDRLFDFCLWEYPPHARVEGKLRSINLLNRSFAAHPQQASFAALIAALRAGLGESRTVWGIKHSPAGLAWEFYFYDYARLTRERSAGKVLEIIRPWAPCGIAVSDLIPYFMFSIDFDPAALAQARPLNDIQVYIGNAGSTVSSGICYEFTRERALLKNFYFFFNARTEMEAIIDKLATSAYLALPGLGPEAILWPELRRCETIVVANKRSHDGVYFCRINVDQLLFFLKRLEYPQAQVEFVENHRARLDHLLYDVGIDYRVEDGQLKILKSAYYGVF